MIGRRDRLTQQGAALVVAVLALALIAAVGASLALTSGGEAIVAGDFARVEEARYAAEAALECGIADLRSIDDWTALPGGDVMSRLTDGPAFGVRRLAGGGALDLSVVVNLANCGKTTTCATADLTTNTAGQRPWGANNPVWRLFAHAPIAALLPAAGIRSDVYVVVLLADDPLETDANPLIDGGQPCNGVKVPPECNPGSGVLAVRAEAFAARGAHQIVQALVERPKTPDGRVKIRTEVVTGNR